MSASGSGRGTPSSGKGAFFPPSGAALPRTLGKYTLLWHLGSGGMADAYLALQRGAFGFEKLVVVKCLKPALADEARVVQMFMDEARLGTTLAHANIVQVFDAGASDDGYFIVMEYVEGVDLRKVRRLRRGKGQPSFPLEHGIYVVSELLSGLSYAHQKRDLSGAPLGIVHRDISPGNVLLSFSGGVKVTDFGVAKSALQLGERTAFGELKGKIAYMSPEQAQGQTVDLRTDLFAAAAILYELTTGVRLFGNLSEADTLAVAMTGEHARPRSVCRHFPEALEEIVERGLAAKQDARYQSAREMQRDLLHFAREAGLGVAEAAFSDWISGELAETQAQQCALLKSARGLDRVAKTRQEGASPAEPEELIATRHSSTPPPASGAGSRTRDAPAASTTAEPQRSLDAALAARSDLESETAVDAGPPDTDGPSTLLSSAQSLHPAVPRRRAPKPRRRGTVLRTLAAAGALTAVALVMASEYPDVWSRITRAVRVDAIEQLMSALRARWNGLGGSRPPPGAEQIDNAIVELDVSPTGACLWLDGQPVIVPRLSVARGERRELQAAAPGYAAENRVIEPLSSTEQVSISLSPLSPDTGSTSTLWK